MVQGGIDTFTRTTPILLSTPEPSAASTPPPISMTSTSPPGAAAVQHIADRRTFSDVLDVPSSPTPVLDNMPPTESHSSMLATAPLGPSPHVTSAPDLGAAVGEGSTKAASQKGRDAPDPPSASRANIMAASDLSPHLPSSASDVAISGPSRRSPDTEHIGDHPQHLSHGQYDIV
ncbi:hypothetical protein BJY52DRAFT_1317099 [Lactarius psammicola]|nr:hypothetical protein BJY52DRAFT_1317099 [Lactarius psammicola]